MATNGNGSADSAHAATSPSALFRSSGSDGFPSLDDLDLDESLSFLDEMPETLAGGLHSPPRPVPTHADDNASAHLLDVLLSLQPDQAEQVQLETQVKSEAPVKSKSAMSRSRQKQEIEYLRAQLAELESELAMLKQPAVVATSSSAVNGERAVVWENIAKRQLDEKQRAEIENVKLREQLEGQLRIARSLEKLLRKRVVRNCDDPIVFGRARAVRYAERKRARGAAGLNLEDAQNEIRLRIHRQFDDVDEMIRQCGLANATHDLNDARAISDPSNSICMEMVLLKVFPFEFHSVADAVWQCVSASRIKLGNGYYGASYRSENMCELSFAVKLNLRRSDSIIRVRGIGARRVVNTTRSIIVLESVGATDGQLFADQRINCRERGYVLIETTSGSSIAPSTTVRVCVRVSPEVETDDSLGSDHMPPQVGRFVDLIVGSYHQNTKVLLQVIENILLQPLSTSSPLRI